MEKKDFIIIGLIVIIAIGAITIALSSLNDDKTDKKNITVFNNNTTQNEVSNEKVASQPVSQQKEYDDWQEDEFTGEYDSNGNPIYKSRMSTSGGQYEPGIYEMYWSSDGPISEEKIE